MKVISYDNWLITVNSRLNRDNVAGRRYQTAPPPVETERQCPA